MSSWIAAATSYSVSDTPDDPVLHLLLDVRVPADRRPGLGRRRLAGPRLPDRRHRRADHAQRRGPAARGRPQPPAVGDHPELRLLRPDLRLRGRGDRAGRAAPDVRRAGGRLLLPHRDERELPAPGHARRAASDEVREGIIRGMYLLREGQPAKKGDAPGAAAGQRHDPARGDRRRRAAGSRLRAWPPTSGAARASPSCAATASTSSAGTCCTRARAARISYVGERLAGRPAGPVVAATDYMRAFADQIRAVRARRALPRARHRRVRPLGLPPQPAPRTSRSTGTTSLLAALRRAGRRGRRPGDRPWRTRSTAYGIDPDKPNPAAAPERRRTTVHDDDDCQPHRGQGPRHRRLQRRPDHRGARQRRATRSTPRTRWSPWSPTRRRWTCPPRRRHGRARCWSRSATRSARAPDPAARPRRRVRSPRRRRWSSSRSRAARAHAGRPTAAGRPAGRGRPRSTPRRRRRRPGGCARRAVACGGWPASWASTSPRSRRPGPKGRITKDDLLAFLQGPAQPARPRPAARAGSGIPEIPAQDFSKFGPVETRPLSRIKKISGPFLHRSWLNVPHVTHNDEADITELDALPQGTRHRGQGREGPTGSRCWRSW